MGRHRKPFIDKKKAVTYRLVFKSSEYGDEPGERVFVPVRGPAEGCFSGFGEELGQPSSGPMSAEMARQFFFGGQDSEVTEEQREEMISMGLPDDGYNYLQHLRTVGKGKANLERIPEESTNAAAETTESVGTSSTGGIVAANFQPPEEDRKIVNARNLTSIKEVEDETCADANVGTTSAFSREVEGVRGQIAREIKDLDEFMDGFEETVVAENLETEGFGDLLDDFVITATKAGDQEATLMGDERVRSRSHRLAMPEDLSDDDDGEEDIIEYDFMSRYGDTLGSRGLGNRSAFSEKWVGTSASDLEGRRERSEQLSLLDERFENMLLDYDDDELGDLEEYAEEIQGESDIREYAPEIELFVGDMKMKGLKALMREPQEISIFEKDEDVVRITKNLESAAIKGRRRVGRDEWEDVLVCVRTNAPRLDCETVLSYRSKTTSYQPSRIDVVREDKKKSSQPPLKIDTSGQVKLSAKSGFPLEAFEQANKDDGGVGSPDVRDSMSNVDQVIPTERKKGETAEEKKARKAAVKLAQRQARVDKKELKMMYRKEHLNQQKQMAGIITKNASTVIL